MSNCAKHGKRAEAARGSPRLPSAPAARLRFTDLTFRDGHQSLFVARMRTGDMEPIAEAVGRAGYHALEVWGGATFDTMHRFLGEDPWERPRRLRRVSVGELVEAPAGPGVKTYRMYVDGEYFQVAVEGGGASPSPPPPSPPPECPAESDSPAPGPRTPGGNSHGGRMLVAPMPGTVIECLVGVGDPVKAGDAGVILEAMKRENSLEAPVEGVVREVPFQKGDSVARDDVLVRIE